MFDVFSEEDERLIKDGMAHLYWFRDDLRKAWLRSEVEKTLADKIYHQKRIDGTKISKREMMDELYQVLRNADRNTRVGISRRFVKILVEHRSFTPQAPEHRIEFAERCALKLKERIREQNREKSRKAYTKKPNASKKDRIVEADRIKEEFTKVQSLEPQKRGYELEKIFPKLMKLHDVEVEESFKIVGEQIDGAIKYEGHFYLIELK